MPPTLVPGPGPPEHGWLPPGVELSPLHPVTARGYRDAMGAATPWQAVRASPARLLMSAWPWRCLAYLVTGAPLGMAALVALPPLVVTGVGPVLFGTALATVERHRLRLVDRAPAPSPHERRQGSRRGIRGWLATRLSEPVTWQELAFAVLAATVLWAVEAATVVFAVCLTVLPLLALRVNLGLARLEAARLEAARHMSSDSPELARLVTDAHEESKAVLDQLRDLVRGAAVAELAGRSTVPVTMDILLDGRLPLAAETTAYYVISEALVNVDKHSGARLATVTVRHAGRALTVEVRDDAAGGTVIDPKVVSQLLARHRSRSPVDTLTDREKQVLALMAEGRTNAAIARTLFLSEQSVTKHIAAIFGKLGLAPAVDDNRRVLAVLAYLRGPSDQPSVRDR